MKLQKIKPLFKYIALALILSSGGLSSAFSSNKSGAEKRSESVKHFKKWVTIGDSTYVHTPVDYSPPKAQTITHSQEDFTILLYALSFARGEPVYIEVIPRTKKTNLRQVSFSFNGNEVIVSKHSWGYRGFVGIHPDYKSLSASFAYKVVTDQNKYDSSFSIPLAAREFPVSKSLLEVGKYSDKSQAAKPEVTQFIEKSRKKKEAAYSRESPNALKNKWSHPRDYHYITSEFWATRIYSRYEVVNGKRNNLPPRTSIHRGLDFRARTGEPIFAIGDGKVVLAEELYYEGNCVFIDHGNSIFSAYFHFSDIRVGKYQNVKAGQLLGYAGSTGVATAAHLHMAFYISGVPVNPLSLLSLPIRL